MFDVGTVTCRSCNSPVLPRDMRGHIRWHLIEKAGLARKPLDVFTAHDFAVIELVDRRATTLADGTLVEFFSIIPEVS